MSAAIEVTSLSGTPQNNYDVGPAAVINNHPSDQKFKPRDSIFQCEPIACGKEFNTVRTYFLPSLPPNNE
jgi:hypothetical protein